MVLTEESQQDAYPAATMEDALATAEETFYSNLPETRTSLPAGYPANSASGNAKVAKVNGTVFSEGNKIGPAIALKVMAGDKFNVQVNSWYKNNLQPDEGIPAPTGIITQLIAALQNAVSGIAGVKANPTDLYNSGALLPGANTFISNQASSSNGNAPRAYLNWILFDEQFKLVSSSSGFDQVPEESYYNNGSIPNNNTKLHVHSDMPITKSGFLYIYVSNETPNIDVFFDNLQVTHVRGQILEETHYYPFGLIQSGISSKAAGSLENKKRFTGQLFDDDLGWNTYQMKWRTMDPQIGRFLQIDPLASDYVSNSTFAYAENKVTTGADLEGLEHVDFRDMKKVDDWGAGKITTDQMRRDTYESGVAGMIGTGIVLSFMYPGTASLIMLSHLSGVPLNGSPQMMAETTASTVVSETKPVTTAASTIENNAAQGAAFEQKVGSGLANAGDIKIAPQITIKADNGAKTRVDFVSTNKSGQIVLTEAKSSSTAPLTGNQKSAFPSIAQNGGVVVGKGKPDYPGGTVIPPTQINIVRPAVDNTYVKPPPIPIIPLNQRRN